MGFKRVRNYACANTDVNAPKTAQQLLVKLSVIKFHSDLLNSSQVPIGLCAHI